MILSLSICIYDACVFMGLPLKHKYLKNSFIPLLHSVKIIVIKSDPVFFLRSLFLRVCFCVICL